MAERIGVIRDNGLVVNTILWGDETDDQLVADGITDFEEVTGMSPMPGIGWLWDEENGYRPPKPYTSWVWNDGSWVAPKAYPTDGKTYVWDEPTKKWVEQVTE